VHYILILQIKIPPKPCFLSPLASAMENEGLDHGDKQAGNLKLQNAQLR